MAFLPMPYSSAYCASKHALRGLSESVDHEVRGFGIRVIAIEPGFIRTDIAQHSPVATPIQAYAAARAFPVRQFRKQLELWGGSGSGGASGGRSRDCAAPPVAISA